MDGITVTFGTKCFPTAENVKICGICSKYYMLFTNAKLGIMFS